MIPLLSIVFLTPLSQEIYIFGFHLFVIRILILTGCIRMAWTKYSSSAKILAGGFTSLDKAFLLWATFRALAFILLFLVPGAVVNRFGFLWDALGGYFLLRFLVQDQKDIQRVVRCFAVFAIILAACMLNEQFTGHNIFGTLGGVRTISEIRDGRIRSQAAFGHPLLAGAWGGTTFPLFVLLWKFGRAKLLALAAMMSCVVMVVTSATSTSILALGAGILGLLFWPFRRHMREIRWGIIVGILLLQVAMHAPVWYVISHIDLTGGSSSYQRAVLIDHFICNFGDWWLLGTKSNASWGADMWDTINQYVQEGEDGGLATLICFVALIVISFRWIGKARKMVQGDRRKELYYWILGATLFAHTIGYFGISYFDSQTRMSWYALLCMISAATVTAIRKPAELQQSFAPPPMPELETQARSESSSSLFG
ncbi:MAG: hypothetical protein WAM69_12120 [Candidatus Sulfotelmatobacter sp.]